MNLHNILKKIGFNVIDIRFNIRFPSTSITYNYNFYYLIVDEYCDNRVHYRISYHLYTNEYFHTKLNLGYCTKFLSDNESSLIKLLNIEFNTELRKNKIDELL